MMEVIDKYTKPESIIEYSQENDSPAFSYNKEDGAIGIFADESTWIWRNGLVKINSAMYYNNDYYVILFLPCIEKKNIISVDTTLPSGMDTIALYNTGIFPKHIKKGELLGKAYVIPKVESHILKLEKE